VAGVDSPGTSPTSSTASCALALGRSRTPLASGRRPDEPEGSVAGQEALAWQSLGFYFVAEGILITAALTHHHRMAIHVLGGVGCVSSLIFLHMFVKARWFELINSRWLRVNAQIDHDTIADSVKTPEGYEKQFADHWPTTWIVLLPARIIWPVVLFVSAVLWAIYAFGVFE
jgi:hypothetical protein